MDTEGKLQCGSRASVKTAVIGGNWGQNPSPVQANSKWGYSISNTGTPRYYLGSRRFTTQIRFSVIVTFAQARLTLSLGRT